jgi:hypothetical protein
MIPSNVLRGAACPGPTRAVQQDLHSCSVTGIENIRVSGCGVDGASPNGQVNDSYG